MNKFEPCKLCRGKKGPQPGYYYAKSPRDNRDVVVECKCHSTWVRNAEVESRCKASGVDTLYTFDNYRGYESQRALTCLKYYADNFKEYNRYTMPYLYGPNGTQKTSMAKVVGKTLIQNGFTVKFVLMGKLVELLMDVFEKKEETKTELDACRDADLLIIDECFDPTKVMMFKTGYQLPNLDSFLRNRYEGHGKPIMFISNIKPEQIEEMGYGKSLQSLITRNCQNCTFTFTDVYFECDSKPDPLSLFPSNLTAPRPVRRVVSRQLSAEENNSEVNNG